MTMTAAASQRPPLSPKEGWLIHGRQVPCFCPTRCERQAWGRQMEADRRAAPDGRVEQLAGFTAVRFTTWGQVWP